MQNSHQVSVAAEVANPRQLRPHLVILGAGASRAAFPTGDANGRALPVMQDFVETLSLERLLDDARILWRGVNFETIYSNLIGAKNHTSIRSALEKAVEDYFLDLDLPAYPTIYDEVLLSLRKKDVIATFNWDLFLIQAARRVGRVTKSLPYLLFLHGNVAHGFCAKDAVSGVRGAICSRCHRPFVPDRLLFPVETKDYSNDPAIAASWAALRRTLQDALFVTIFGYGAPQSDRDAVAFMADAWGAPKDRQFEQFEIVDIRPEKDLRNTWSPFIHTHHYECHAGWRDCFLANHPRRSVEAFVNQFIEAKFIENNPAPRARTLDDLFAWYGPLISAEAGA